MYDLSLFTNLFILSNDRNYVNGILEEFFFTGIFVHSILQKNKIDAYF